MKVQFGSLLDRHHSPSARRTGVAFAGHRPLHGAAVDSRAIFTRGSHGDLSENRWVSWDELRKLSEFDPEMRFLISKKENQISLYKPSQFHQGYEIYGRNGHPVIFSEFHGSHGSHCVPFCHRMVEDLGAFGGKGDGLQSRVGRHSVYAHPRWPETCLVEMGCTFWCTLKGPWMKRNVT